MLRPSRCTFFIACLCLYAASIGETPAAPENDSDSICTRYDKQLLTHNQLPHFQHAMERKAEKLVTKSLKALRTWTYIPYDRFLIPLPPGSWQRYEAPPSGEFGGENLVYFADGKNRVSFSRGSFATDISASMRKYARQQNVTVENLAAEDLVKAALTESVSTRCDRKLNPASALRSLSILAIKIMYVGIYDEISTLAMSKNGKKRLLAAKIGKRQIVRYEVVLGQENYVLLYDFVAGERPAELEKQAQILTRRSRKSRSKPPPALPPSLGTVRALYASTPRAAAKDTAKNAPKLFLDAPLQDAGEIALTTILQPFALHCLGRSDKRRCELTLDGQIHWLPASLEKLRQTCDVEQQSQACLGLAKWYQSGGDLTQAAQFVVASCRLGNANACSMSADLHRLPKLTREIRDQLLLAACQEGDDAKLVSTCYNKAVQQAKSTPNEAAIWYAVACSRGHVDACLKRIQLFPNESDYQSQKEAYSAYFIATQVQRGGEHPSAFSPEQLGISERHAQRFLADFQKICEMAPAAPKTAAGSGNINISPEDACSLVGVLYRQAHRQAQSFASFMRSCERGVAHACIASGTLCAEQAEVCISERVIAALAPLCTGPTPYAPACHSLSDLYRSLGHPAEATALLSRVCPVQGIAGMSKPAWSACAQLTVLLFGSSRVEEARAMRDALCAADRAECIHQLARDLPLPEAIATLERTCPNPNAAERDRWSDCSSFVTKLFRHRDGRAMGVARQVCESSPQLCMELIAALRVEARFATAADIAGLGCARHQTKPLCATQRPLLDQQRLTDAQAAQAVKVMQLEALRINFAAGSAQLDADAMATAAKLRDTLQQHRRLIVQIEAHADPQEVSTNDGAIDLELSDRRGRVVRDYLVAHGIEDTRVSVLGFGGSVGEEKPARRTPASSLEAAPSSRFVRWTVTTTKE